MNLVSHLHKSSCRILTDALLMTFGKVFVTTIFIFTAEDK